MDFVANVKTEIINPIIGLLVGVALVYFLYGVYESLIDPYKPVSVEKGKRHMLWGVIGLFIMIAVMGIANVIADTINVIK